MTLEEALDYLRRLSTRTYSYIVLAAILGPLTLRVLGLSSLARLIRPLAVLIVLGGMYAKQQTGAAK